MPYLFATKKRQVIGKVILVSISTLLAVMIYLFYTNFINRDIYDKGFISEKFWQNIYYKDRHSISEHGFLLNPGKTLSYMGNRNLQWPTVVTINKDGYRDIEYSQKKAPGVYRILLLGDSMVFGLGVNLEDTFAKVLEKQLNQTGNRYEVLNGGLPDSSLYFQLHFFKNTFSGYNPDIIIWFYSPSDYNCFTINTAQQMATSSYLREHAGGLFQKWEELNLNFKNNNHGIAMQLHDFRQGNHVQHIPELLNVCIKQPILELKHIIEPGNTRLLFVILEDHSLFIWQISEFIRNLGVQVANNFDYIEILKKHCFALEYDNHLTVKGNLLFGNLLFSYLMKNQLLERQPQ